MHKKFQKIRIPICFIIFALLLNLLGICSFGFCNWYVAYIFPIWVNTYGRLTGLFPFSVGEIMLYLAVFLVGVFLIGGLFRILCYKIISDRWKKYYKNYSCFLLWVFGIVCVVMTLNCFLLYHVSPISVRYDIGGSAEEEYGLKEVEILRDYVVDEANRLSAMMERDENGYLIYKGNMKEEAKKQMQRLGESFDALQGYYPNPKPLLTSEFFSQQYMMGYYFPFSMEANYNDEMYCINMPTTMCHELSHIKGFILEDEANFIGYLACVDSEDLFFRYSAYLSVIYYLDQDFYEACGENAEYYKAHPAINEQVRKDKTFLTEEAWEKVEEKAVIETEVVKELSNTFTETTLTLNGVSDGKISYSRVVNLLLQYYDGKLYVKNASL